MLVNYSNNLTICFLKFEILHEFLDFEKSWKMRLSRKRSRRDSRERASQKFDVFFSRFQSIP